MTDGLNYQLNGATNNIIFHLNYYSLLNFDILIILQLNIFLILITLLLCFIPYWFVLINYLFSY